MANLIDFPIKKNTVLKAAPEKWELGVHKLIKKTDFENEGAYYRHRAFEVQCRIDKVEKSADPKLRENRKQLVAESIRIYTHAIEDNVNPESLKLRAQIDDLTEQVNLTDKADWDVDKAKELLAMFELESSLGDNGFASQQVADLSDRRDDFVATAEMAESGKISNARAKQRKADTMVDQLKALVADGGIDIKALLASIEDSEV